ncbi:DNA-3-methyladenine glycosylase I [Leadbetterella byssophila]|uniref:DNA-3-methyladenine glycosylase I n=1 Tax=Leadbetterella byssophila TaxID=316068 RepID=UPI0039A3A067
MSYCTYVQPLPEDNLHKIYHDHHYGYPIEDDNELFERLVLEINQAGLSWDLMLKKQKNFQNAYSNFHIATVAAYGEEEVIRLLQDAGIVRNRLKVAAAIHNAKVIIELQEEYGSFKKWLDFHRGKKKEEWMKLFKKTFKFTGGEIVNEFLMSTGYLPGAHDEDCPIYSKLTTL